MAEFALMLPVLVLVMLVAVDLGRVYFAAINLTNIARIGANYAAQNAEAWSGSGSTTIKARYQTLMRNDAGGIDCTLPTTLPAPTFEEPSPDTYSLGSGLHVTLTCRFQLISPFLFGIVGDSSGGMTVTSSANFRIRAGSVPDVIIGGDVATPTPTASPIVPPIATPLPTAITTPDPGASLGATPTIPAPTPPTVTFYGNALSDDASGGGPPGSPNEAGIVGVAPLTIEFINTTQGGNCLWQFGDLGTSNSCGYLTHTYTTRGTYNVSLTVDGGTLTRQSYVTVACRVPPLSGVRKANASSIWVAAGFAAGNLTALDGNGNYKIGYQSLAGGIVNPPGGCSGATIQVGP